MEFSKDCRFSKEWQKMINDLNKTEEIQRNKVTASEARKIVLKELGLNFSDLALIQALRNQKWLKIDRSQHVVNRQTTYYAKNLDSGFVDTINKTEIKDLFLQSLNFRHQARAVVSGDEDLSKVSFVIDRSSDIEAEIGEADYIKLKKVRLKW